MKAENATYLPGLLNSSTEVRMRTFRIVRMRRVSQVKVIVLLGSLTVDGRSRANSAAAGCRAAEERDHLKTGWDFTWIKRKRKVVR